MNPLWKRLCRCDVSDLRHWLLTKRPWPIWPSQSAPGKPRRIHEAGLPMHLLVQPIIDQVLTCFAEPVRSYEPMLSLMPAGQQHPMHVDVQRADWITRVHVPIVTNPGAWIAFENENEPMHPGNAHVELGNVLLYNKVHFEEGSAYSFNTLERHAFGNDGTTDRVHLIFEVLRK